MTDRVIARAPSDASHFFGFHDVTPWCPEDRRVLMHRVDSNIRRMPAPDDRADIVLWEPATNSLETVATTTCWNFQQGARAMWVPGTAATFVYNKRVNDAPGCEFVDLATGERTEMPHAIGAIAPDGSFAMAPNFARLGTLWRAYGYSGFASAADRVLQPDDDGLWRIDRRTGARTLVFSIRQLVDAAGGTIGLDVPVFVTHVSFNREGTRIVFMLRFFSKDNALYSLLYSARSDGGELKLIEQEKISHFDWLDETNIVIWMRKAPKGLAAARRSGLLASPLLKPLIALARKSRARLKGALLNESYFVVSTVTGERQTFMPGVLPQDGHPMVSPDGKWMITDEYYNPATGEMPLILVDIAARQRVDVATFHHDVGSADSDLKCDLHPRWNRAGTQVAVDASGDGRRQFTIVDVADLVAGGRG
ncbi:hypothetical protein [Rhizobium sp. SGZ-381]|uniref:hypothetical protein n=1 Tax=Rhizobium sp. SGZ-381 TaxID=3342800 RepID=UPI00366EB6F1